MTATASPGRLGTAGRRSGAFALSVICSVAVPLSPLAAEYAVTTNISASSWSAVGVTYLAGLGLVSRSQTILVILLLAAAVLAFLYGVDMKDAYDHLHMQFTGQVMPALLPGTSGPVKWVIGLASLAYVFERSVRHLVDGKPFLES